jgi:hypothetical protein
MTAAVTVDVDGAARAYESAELEYDDAVSAERVQYGRWRAALTASDVARSEVASLAERAQYERWTAALEAADVARGEADRAWRTYRAAVAG